MPSMRERTFDAGFEFARRLKEKPFREFIKASGWQSGQHVIMATDDTPIRDIIAKMMLHEMEQRALIAIAHEDSEFGFRLVTVEVLKPRRFRRQPKNTTPVSLDASIGMLYTLAEGCPAYVPSDLARDLVFERVSA